MPYKDYENHKEYMKGYHKKRKEENPDYYKEGYEKVKDTENYKESHKKRNGKYNKKYPEKVKAKELVGRTPFPKGILCQECQEEIAIERHHPDYSKPLYVIFVCKSCHTELGKREINSDDVCECGHHRNYHLTKAEANMTEKVIHIEICKSYRNNGFNIKVGDIIGSSEASHITKMEVLEEVSDAIDEMFPEPSNHESNHSQESSRVEKLDEMPDYETTNEVDAKEDLSLTKHNDSNSRIHPDALKLKGCGKEIDLGQGIMAKCGEYVMSWDRDVYCDECEKKSKSETEDKE